MTTYPNQKIAHINKPKYKDNFLQIGTEEWQEAARNLSPAAFKIYLYLAGNANGFDLALSQKAIENVLGVSKATYHRAMEQLQEQKYLVLKCGNVWDFFTKPQKNCEVSKMRLESLKNETTQSQKRDLEVSKMSIEIDNINKKNKIDKKEILNQEREWMEGLTAEQIEAAAAIGF